MAAVQLPDLPSRTEQRRRFAVPVRVELAETDLDNHDRRFAEVMGKLDKLNARAIGILISMMTTSVLLAVDVARHV